ncbi:hypothetical protein DEH69_19975 [Streptomyces sp. PT12]|nr:hypothetical protein DEH69_19975 [Streptomyces sp. PT12]
MDRPAPTDRPAPHGRWTNDTPRNVREPPAARGGRRSGGRAKAPRAGRPPPRGADAARGAGGGGGCPQRPYRSGISGTSGISGISGISGMSGSSGISGMSGSSPVSCSKLSSVPSAHVTLSWSPSTTAVPSVHAASAGSHVRASASPSSVPLHTAPDAAST